MKLENNQNTIQKVNVATSVVLELYRVMVSSFLILFVPQKCGDHVCSYSENLVLENELYSSGIVLNFVTMFCFFILYIIEIRRENKLITYLDVNKHIACDNETVGNMLKKLDDTRKNAILNLDLYYKYIGYTCIVIFSGNSILSGVVVYNYYLDNQTTTTLITNILFMISKLYDVYLTVHTDKNIFYSAYLKEKVQYNEVDPKKKFLNYSKSVSEPEASSSVQVADEQSSPT